MVLASGDVEADVVVSDLRDLMPVEAGWVFDGSCKCGVVSQCVTT